MNTAAMTGEIQWTLGLAVQPNQNKPVAKSTPPNNYEHISLILAGKSHPVRIITIGGSRPSGTGLPLLAFRSLLYRD